MTGQATWRQEVPLSCVTVWLQHCSTGTGRGKVEPVAPSSPRLATHKLRFHHTDNWTKAKKKPLRCRFNALIKWFFRRIDTEANHKCQWNTFFTFHWAYVGSHVTSSVHVFYFCIFFTNRPREHISIYLLRCQEPCYKHFAFVGACALDTVEWQQSLSNF